MEERLAGDANSVPIKGNSRLYFIEGRDDLMPQVEAVERINQQVLGTFEASYTFEMAILNAAALLNTGKAVIDEHGLSAVPGYEVIMVGDRSILMPLTYKELLLDGNYLPAYFRNEWSHHQIQLKQLLAFYNIAKEQTFSLKPKLSFAKDRDSNKVLDTYKDQIKFLERQMAKLEQKQHTLALASNPELPELYKGLQAQHNIMQQDHERNCKDYRECIKFQETTITDLRTELRNLQIAHNQLKTGSHSMAKDITALRTELAFVGLRCEQYEPDINPIITVENEELAVTGRKYRPVKRSIKPKIA